MGSPRWRGEPERCAAARRGFALAPRGRFCDGCPCRGEAGREPRHGAADNPFAPAKTTVPRESGPFLFRTLVAGCARTVRTSLLIFGTGPSRASSENTGEVFCGPERSGKRMHKRKRSAYTFSACAREAILQSCTLPPDGRHGAPSPRHARPRQTSRFAPANPTTRENLVNFRSKCWLRGARMRTSLLLFGTGPTRAFAENNGEAFLGPDEPPCHQEGPRQSQWKPYKHFSVTRSEIPSDGTVAARLAGIAGLPSGQAPK